VVGDGKLGLLVAQVLREAGAKVVLFGKHPSRIRALETTPVSEAKAHARSFEVVVEASGSESGFALALDLLQPRGALVLKSTFHGKASIDTSRVVVDEIDVIGSRCGRIAPALDLLARGANCVDVDSLISEEKALDEGVAALSLAARPGVLKVLLARR
jgi:threonine dehydrogenase-like Zn-dependent dehydrogenase